MPSLFNSQNTTIQSYSLSAFPVSLSLDGYPHVVEVAVTIFPASAVPVIINTDPLWVHPTYSTGSLSIEVDEFSGAFRSSTITLIHPDDESLSVNIYIRQSN